MARKDLRATWPQAWLTLFGPLLLFFAVRWLVIEPYVIPSGSLIPTLLVHDHIVVNKLAYGIHVPFSKKWIVQWAQPKRGDIIVFRYPSNPDVFYVKRAIGLPGDKISIREGVLFVNGESHPLIPGDGPKSTHLPDDNYRYYIEDNHWVRYLDPAASNFAEVTVPEGHVFGMGDNRDQSSDSRVWGFIPQENLVGRAWLVWLSCDMTLPSAQFLCDPSTIRWDRIFLKP